MSLPFEVYNRTDIILHIIDCCSKFDKLGLCWSESIDISFKVFSFQELSTLRETLDKLYDLLKCIEIRSGRFTL